jgi:hypothetical protein
MTEELKRCLTYIYRCKGKEMLGEHEFVYAASMDLHLLPPKEAQKLLEIVIHEGLLKLEQGMLVPTFELGSEVPTGYTPPEDMIKSHTKQEKKELFSEIAGKIIASAKVTKKEAVSKINKSREVLGVDIEVAALVVARSYGVDISEEIPLVERHILEKTD